VEEDERHSKKIYDKYGTTEDELFDEFINNITSDYTNKEDSKNSEQFGDVISNLVKSLTLNNASYILQSQVAKIYTGTPIDVDKVRNIVWGDKKTSVDDFVDQQKKISEQINKRGELESDVSNLDIMALTREFTRISDKASWAMILEREKDHEQRRLIARRRWEEEDSEAITGEQPSTESTASEQSQEDEEVQTGRSKVSTGRSSSDNALDTAITGGKKFRAGVDTDSIRQQAEERKKQTAEQEQTSEEKEKGTNESKTPSEG